MVHCITYGTHPLIRRRSGSFLTRFAGAFRLFVSTLFDEILTVRQPKPFTRLALTRNLSQSRTPRPDFQPNRTQAQQLQ